MMIKQYSILAGYDVKKAAQVAAFFAIEAGGKINILKLTKLMYLADRDHLEQYDYPILFDKIVSMPHGPVNSLTYNYSSGGLEDDFWNYYITDRDMHDLGVTKKFNIDELDQLSDAEVQVMKLIWTKFGHMNQFELVDYTHKYCKEWNDPNGSSEPISYETVFKFLGKDDSAMLSRAIEEERLLKRAWA